MSAKMLVVDKQTIHASHRMIFRPCLHMECEVCMTCVCHGADELLDPCKGIIFI